MFDENHGRLRVIIPLLRTIEMLIDRLCLESLIGQDKFTRGLLAKLQSELSQTTDIACITAIMNVSSSLISPSSASQKEAVAFVCGLLRHQFPHIRRLAAGKLYVRLIEADFGSNDERSTGIDILLNHPWESDKGKAFDRSANFCEAASQVSKALHVDGLLQ